ncbi:hypothetical protein RQP46_003399 [Phenoliferia psychrophenolica]
MSLPSDESDEELEVIAGGTFDRDRTLSPPPPPPPPTTLLDLPTEILLRIGRALSPLGGGRSAANLRLACSRLSRALTPLVWSSIKLPTDPKQHADLFAHLIRHKEFLPFITSVSYPLTNNLSFVGIAVATLGTLPCLKRLHIEGHHKSLPDALYDEIARLKTLGTLSLASVDLVGRLLYDNWPATTRALALSSCPGAFELPIIPDGWCDSETYAVTFALYLHRDVPRHLDLEIHWGITLPSSNADNLREFPWTPIAGQSITLRILGLVATPDPTEPVKLLNWIGAANLKELSVPVSLALTKHAALRHLVLPSLETLELTSTRSPTTLPVSDRLKEVTYPTLVAFLSATSLPRLSRVLVSGLFDKTSTEKLAGKSIRSLAGSHVHLHGLLDVLLDTNLVELRFANSDGHFETAVQCLFEREKDEERWTPRRVTLW